MPDPTDTSLQIIDSQGITAGHVLYDPYGRVITSQLTTELAQALADQGSLEDPTTGLLHLGGGRFYDPLLGRPLQPNPMGGPPTVPQALNRYAATSVGQPGVGEAAVNTWDPFNDPYLSNIGKSVFGTSLSELTISRLSGYHRSTLVRTPIYRTFTRDVPISEFVDDTLGKVASAGFVAKAVIGAPPGSLRARLFGAGRSFLERVGGFNTRQITEERLVAHYLRRTSQYGTLAGRTALWLKSPAGQLGLGFVLNGGYQAWLDHDNPYIDSTQYRRRWLVAGIAGGIGTGVGLGVTSYLGGAVAGAFLGGPPVWIGIGVATLVGITLDVLVVPQIYESIGANPERRLAPLQGVSQ